MSNKVSWAPGWGRSRRMINRADPDQEERSTNSVSSATQAPSRMLGETQMGITKDFTDMRGPDEAKIASADLTAGGYPICVLTPGRIGGFEGCIEAMAKQTGAEHIVLPGADHKVQDQGEIVNPLLERFWSNAGGT